MLKSLLKYVLCVFVLLMSTYSGSYARLQVNHSHSKHAKSTFQYHAERDIDPLFIKATSSDTEKNHPVIDVVETEVEELTFSRKLSGDRNYLTSVLLKQTSGYFFCGSKKIFQFRQYHSYTPSYRYLMFEVFRI